MQMYSFPCIHSNTPRNEIQIQTHTLIRSDYGYNRLDWSMSLSIRSAALYCTVVIVVFVITSSFIQRHTVANSLIHYAHLVIAFLDNSSVRICDIPSFVWNKRRPIVLTQPADVTGLSERMVRKTERKNTVGIMQLFLLLRVCMNQDSGLKRSPASSTKTAL